MRFVLSRQPIRSLSTKITVGVVTTVLLIGVGSFWVLQDYYRRQMIDSLATSTTVQGELIEQSLRHAMHTRSLDLLAEMVRSLANQAGVENVMILNKQGSIRFASDPAEKGRVLAKSDPTCNICHQQGPSVRGRTVTFDSGHGTQVFRNVNPILNGESCWSCHSPKDRVNGVLIVDYSMAGIEASLGASARKMWFSAIFLTFAIAGVIVLLMRRIVLSRLEGLVRVVDSIEAGKLDAPTDVRGGDEISLLSRHVKRMTDSLNHTLGSLRQREAFLDAVINSADDGIVVVDERRRVVTANRAFEKLVGARTGALVDTRCTCAMLCGDDSEACPALQTARSQQGRHCIRPVTCPDGSMRYYEVSDSPLRNVGGRRQVLEIWRDITERRQLEAKLAHSEHLASLGLLASGVSHEINNPLASITTCLDGLARRLRGGNGQRVPGELPEYLELIRGEVSRCRDLTNRLQLLGRSPRSVLQSVDLCAALHDILALVRYEAEKKNVRVEESLSSDLCPVIADESQVRQVLLNVVLNAIQAIDGPGWLRVSAREGLEGFVELAVTDSGRGIEPSEVHKIFEPFYSARADGRGTGLGLFMSRIIVDQLGGSIAVSSTPGRGSCFTILLPTDVRSGAVEATEPSSVEDEP
jgi:PAS domain S-box-containing protein